MEGATRMPLDEHWIRCLLGIGAMLRPLSLLRARMLQAASASAHSACRLGLLADGSRSGSVGEFERLAGRNVAGLIDASTVRVAVADFAPSAFLLLIPSTAAVSTVPFPLVSTAIVF